MFYAGIGSRETPNDICASMTKVANWLSNHGFVLRSGGASGADRAFENGVLNEKKEIFVPWSGFNGSLCGISGTPEQIKEAFALAKTIHPAWDKLTDGGKKLHARNCFQILGFDLNTPVEFVICWTKNGEIKGGTATAIRLAMKNNIPVVNMFDTNWKNDLRHILKIPKK